MRLLSFHITGLLGMSLCLLIPIRTFISLPSDLQCFQVGHVNPSQCPQSMPSNAQYGFKHQHVSVSFNSNLILLIRLEVFLILVILCFSAPALINNINMSTMTMTFGLFSVKLKSSSTSLPLPCTLKRVNSLYKKYLLSYKKTAVAQSDVQLNKNWQLQKP